MGLMDIIDDLKSTVEVTQAIHKQRRTNEGAKKTSTQLLAYELSALEVNTACQLTGNEVPYPSK